MSLISLLTGGKDYIDLVKSFIDKIFVHEAKKFHCRKHELKIIINYEDDGTMSIMTYSVPENKVWRVIPDKEVQEILIK